jgi:hypothetical protein
MRMVLRRSPLTAVTQGFDHSGFWAAARADSKYPLIFFDQSVYMYT